MPKYKITNKTTGESIVVTGETTPTQETIDEIFSQRSGRQTQGIQPKETTQAPVLERMGQRAMRTMSQPSPFFTGVQQARQGNTLAGAANIATGILQTPFIPLSGAIEGLREVPYVGNPLADLFTAPFNAIGQTYDLANRGIQQGLDYLGVPRNVQNFGMDTQSAQQASKALGELAKTSLGYATPAMTKAGGKLTSTVMEKAGRGLENLAQKAEIKSIKPSFTVKKGLEPFERQARTAREGNYAPTEKGLERLIKDKNQLLEKSQKEIAIAKSKEITIDSKQINSILDAKLAKMKNRADYKEINTAFNDVKERINTVASQYPEGKIPIDAAYELKSSFQKMAADKYEQYAGTNKEAYKSAGHELLNNITENAPNLKQYGLKERDLIELEGTLSRRIAQLKSAPSINWRNVQGAGLALGTGALLNPLAGAAVLGGEYALTSPRALHFESMVLDKLARSMNPNLKLGSVPPILQTTRAVQERKNKQ